MGTNGPRKVTKKGSIGRHPTTLLQKKCQRPPPGGFLFRLQDVEKQRERRETKAKKGRKKKEEKRTCTEKCWHALILHAVPPPPCFLLQRLSSQPSRGVCTLQKAQKSGKIKQVQVQTAQQSWNFWVQTAQKTRTFEHV